MFRAIILACFLLAVSGCNPLTHTVLPKKQQDFSMTLIDQPDWPVIKSSIPKVAGLEQRISHILSRMTLEEKVGQMIQPELQQVSPEEAYTYRLGSLLSGGGSWPNKQKHAVPHDWLTLADQYWLALDRAYQGRGFKVPFMWAIDAVHGHNNVYSSTIFPHNISLGAANDPDLVYRIAKATATEVLTTGADWVFAPTVAVPRNVRWGRTYEGYSEDPQRVHQYAGAVVKGLQGTAAELASDQRVISTVKHWVGDGGTNAGKDKGSNHYSEALLRNIHAAGYFSGLQAGAQSVMVSFNKWRHPNQSKATPIHGSHYLISHVLKQKMGFDGVVISDWNGHEALKGCSKQSCAKAINAGIDVVMVTANADWKAFYKNLIQQVKTQQVPIARIDDAVRRILRVKMRAGLWDKPRPSLRTFAAKTTLLGAPQHRQLAREAVRKSLVLLKNNEATLPLSQARKIILAGSGMDDIARQSGGWTLTWQGTKNQRADFPNATTIKEALVSLLGAEQVVTDIKQASPEHTAIVVISEKPYAEFFGDIKAKQSLQFSHLNKQYAKDLALIRQLKDKGLQVVTIMLSGRPLYINDVLNTSDALVAAWLPGGEAAGITDVLFKNKQGTVAYDFQGRLAYSWPGHPCAAAINLSPTHIKGYSRPDMEQDIKRIYRPLFSFGYGLSYIESKPVTLPPLPIADVTDCRAKQ